MEFLITIYLNAILLIILFFSALRDWKDHIIPNVYLIRGAAIRVLLLLHEVAVNGTEAIKALMIKVALCLLILAIGLLIKKLTKDGVGMGDIKLCGLMFLYLESNVWFSSIFVSLILGAIHAFIVTIGKQEKERIPFGPSLFVGTALVMICNI